ncbi:MAG: hypothetical protein SF339_10890 [Blastocatellia bacterium]|nr:hypothetical protein [Blastocatellia bacterium]
MPRSKKLLMLMDFVVGRAAFSGGELPMAFRYEKRASREDAKALRKVIFEFFSSSRPFFSNPWAGRLAECLNRKRRREEDRPSLPSRFRVFA